MVVLTRLHLFTLEQVAGRGRRDAKSRLPAIYPYRYFAAGGGLSSVMNSRRLN
jgi:hypothetical protein